ncbi:MAG: hypothetical protein HYW80_01440, partial [Parcubacteria group bacterium]|nr:hypothetical protein [Parcubacteria group bacterium]
EKYLKYYFLEDYLFNDVSKNFQERGYLTPEEFFAIVIWKSNRVKTNVRRGIGKSRKTIRKITSEVFQSKTLEQKLEALISIPSIGIPMASAILTVCYPNDFTVADYRAHAALKDFGEEIAGNPTARISTYFEYLNKCKKIAKRYNLSLRNFDRVLWAKDFYEGTNGLKHLAK